MPFEKGNNLGKGRPVGVKNRATLLKEERRAIFDQKASEKWEETIDKLPPTYIADQFLGKAPDKVELNGNINVTQLTQEQIDAINKIALDE